MVRSLKPRRAGFTFSFLLEVGSYTLQNPAGCKQRPAVLLPELGSRETSHLMELVGRAMGHLRTAEIKIFAETKIRRKFTHALPNPKKIRLTR